MTDHYDRLRKPLTHWTIYRTRYDDYLTFLERGDAYVEMVHGPRVGEHVELYEAWVKLVEAQMDKSVDEARCKETGGHDMQPWGDEGDRQCVKCLHVEWVEREEVGP